jgi:hypothetical protein
LKLSESKASDSDETTIAMAFTADDPVVKPLNWANSPYWLRQTLSVERKTYRQTSRPMSLNRLKGLLHPNLNQPIFILGSPRSGTTFLGSCIAELPEISYHYEPVATKAAARYIYHQEWNFNQAKQYYWAVYAWLMRLHANGDLRFAEKTPRNCFLVDFLYRAFPDAQFIHIIRDGRDSALSHSKQPWLQAAAAKSNLRETSGYRHGPYARFWVETERVHEFETTSDIHRCIWAWRRHVSTILESVQTLPAAQYYELRYENLVTQPQQEAQALLNYLNIHSVESCEKLYHAFARARADSIDGWRRELSAADLQQIDDEAGFLLQRLGYG